MTAILDKKTGQPTFAAIQRVASDFPNAVRFPLYISNEQYRFETDENETFVKFLLQSLHSSSVDRFLLELRRLEDPTHVFKDLCDRLEVRRGPS